MRKRSVAIWLVGTLLASAVVTAVLAVFKYTHHATTFLLDVALVASMVITMGAIIGVWYRGLLSIRDSQGEDGSGQSDDRDTTKK